MKTCSKCGALKELTEFSIRASGPKSGKPRASCKKCENEIARQKRKDNPGLYRAAIDRWQKKNPERVRYHGIKGSLKRLYGISPEDKERLFAEQQGICAICGDVFSSVFSAHVDHIHDTQPAVIRGLLCHGCNTSLGGFKDSPELLLKAAAYLKKFL